MAINQTPLRFVPTGYGNGVCANHVFAVLTTVSAPSKRLLAKARKEKRYVDATCGRGMKSMLLLADGHVIGCAIKPATMLRRLNASEYEDEESFEEEG